MVICHCFSPSIIHLNVANRSYQRVQPLGRGLCVMLFIDSFSFAFSASSACLALCYILEHTAIWFVDMGMNWVSKYLLTLEL